jgi:hypothetical protein
MQSFIWLEQAFQDHVLNHNECKFLTCWQQECPNCGEKIALSPFQRVHEVNDFCTEGRIYARLLTVCMYCNQPLTEMWSIN